ncbi:SPOR domain-containing protein [Winogradskyella endarachnes]|uniref:SPOR domain-containing protein n=1 Tax=Winogradskyella endarachnes TaxID=2681965 RepID=A0A6L6UE93_9FLAO|nr:SPOR domain-containing protein [Winogradskyella endarachnes]MUU79262.1 SPOR domain-containing protein [Winogradskyella endarachnes]
MNIKKKIVWSALLSFTLTLVLNAQQGKVVVTQNSDIDTLLKYKKDLKTSKTYTIQVYNSTDPDKAKREKENFLNIYNDWDVEIVWNTPNYKVWVGNFATRLEADRAWAKIRKKYMNANVIQPRLDD